MAQAENDMTKTLVVVVLMFMFCQLLNPIRRILLAVLPPDSLGCGSFFSYFSGLTSPALALDASSHFFVYSVCNRRFNEKLSQKWRHLVARSKVTPSAGLGTVHAQSAGDQTRRAPRAPAALALATSDNLRPSSSCAITNTVV